MCHAGRRRRILGLWPVALLLAGAACPERAPIDEPGPVDTAVSAPPEAPAEPSAELAASEAGPHELGPEPLTVTLAVPAAVRERLAALAAGARPGRLRLAIEDVELLRPGAVYQVHLEPAAGRTPDPGDPSFLGNLALYGRSERPSTRTFDVTDRARALWAKGAPAGPVRVAFVLAHAEEAKEAAAGGPFLRFRRVVLAGDTEHPPSPSDG